MEDKEQRYEDEIYLKEIVVSTANLVFWLKTHAVKLFIICLVFSALAIIWAIRQPEYYSAELTFMLNDENNPQVSGVSGVLGQLGIPISSGKYNVDKLLEIAKSRRLIQSTILMQARVNDKQDFMANHLIEMMGLGQKWSEKDMDFLNIRFKSTRIDDFSDNEKFALKALYQLIAGNKQNRSKALFTTGYGQTDYIMSFSFKSPSEELSIAFVNQHYNEVSNFYVDKAVAKNRAVYELITDKRDSLSVLINDIAFELADLKDKSSGSFRSKNDVQINLLQNKLIGIQASYSEIEKNLGRAEYALETSTPLIQLLDRPSLPLAPSGRSVLKFGLAGAFFGILFYGVIIFLNQVIIQLRKN